MAIRRARSRLTWSSTAFSAGSVPRCGICREPDSPPRATRRGRRTPRGRTLLGLGETFGRLGEGRLRWGKRRFRWGSGPAGWGIHRFDWGGGAGNRGNAAWPGGKAQETGGNPPARPETRAQRLEDAGSVAPGRRRGPRPRPCIHTRGPGSMSTRRRRAAIPEETQGRKSRTSFRCSLVPGPVSVDSIGPESEDRTG
jgi:hypothetical protein